jgi:hypothetical protein
MSLPSAAIHSGAPCRRRRAGATHNDRCSLRRVPIAVQRIAALSIDSGDPSLANFPCGLLGYLYPTFSEQSYGFVRDIQAHQAVVRAQDHVTAGYRWIVDFDYEKFLESASS